MIPVLLADGLNWHSVFFLLFALVSCVFALAVLFSQNIVRMAFYLVICLGAVSGLFFLAGAHFVGAMQLMIYVGGTLVLLIFGVMLTAQAQFIQMRTGGGEWVLAAIVGGSLLTLLMATAFSVTSWQRPAAEHLESIADIDVSSDATALGTGLIGARPDKLNQSDEQLRRGMSGYLLPFEIVSVHLLVVLIGAAYLARSKRYVPGRTAEPTAPAPVRHRGALATGILLLALAGHAGCGAACFMMWGATELHAQIPGFASAARWIWPAMGASCLLGAFATLVILNWQKWGYFALCALALAEAALIFYVGAAPWAGGAALLAAVVWLAILFGILKMGGQRSMWSQME